MENIFKILLKEKTWKKLVTLDTPHWYYEGPEPMAIAHLYNSQARQRESVAYSFLIFFKIHFSAFCLTLSFRPLWYKNGRR